MLQLYKDYKSELDKVSKDYNLFNMDSASSGVYKANFPINLNLWAKIPYKSQILLAACPEGNITKDESKTYPFFK